MDAYFLKRKVDLQTVIKQVGLYAYMYHIYLFNEKKENPYFLIIILKCIFLHISAINLIISFFYSNMTKEVKFYDHKRSFC